MTFDLGIGILSVCTVFVFTAFLKRTSATYLKYILQPQVVPLRSCNIVVHYLYSCAQMHSTYVIIVSTAKKHFQYSQSNKIYLLIFFLDYWSTKVP